MLLLFCRYRLLFPLVKILICYTSYPPLSTINHVFKAIISTLAQSSDWIKHLLASCLFNTQRKCFQNRPIMQEPQGVGFRRRREKLWRCERLNNHHGAGSYAIRHPCTLLSRSSRRRPRRSIRSIPNHASFQCVSRNFQWRNNSRRSIE